jgi:cell division protein FtsB
MTSGRPTRWRVVVAGLLGLAVLAILVLGGNGLLRVWRMKQAVEALQRDIQLLEAENDRLARTIDRLREDPGLIEKIAREELGYVREGERVLKFPATPKPARDSR